MADEMLNGAMAEIKRSYPNNPINIEAYKESKEMARDNAAGIM